MFLSVPGCLSVSLGAFLCPCVSLPLCLSVPVCLPVCPCLSLSAGRLRAAEPRAEAEHSNSPAQEAELSCAVTEHWNKLCRGTAESPDWRCSRTVWPHSCALCPGMKSRELGPDEPLCSLPCPSWDSAISAGAFGPFGVCCRKQQFSRPCSGDSTQACAVGSCYLVPRFLQHL